ncbi:PREDICTED: uncharacterized protein LOC105143296 [Acromyrmex echinatior]|uniref:uncharacterized protein LOC105143296 n=1 Tax=Acromyrmex echinatior TaxID=103372 RepID=UPI000580D0BA|nr:PREDICTED: uncharacterized protein LOC105143296 [Acromyrmex echinatior]
MNTLSLRYFDEQTIADSMKYVYFTRVSIYSRCAEYCRSESSKPKSRRQQSGNDRGKYRIIQDNLNTTPPSLRYISREARVALLVENDANRNLKSTKKEATFDYRSIENVRDCKRSR